LIIRERKNTALVAIGSNLTAADGRTPLETCREAAMALGRLPGWRLVKLSRWYRTVPDPPLPGAPRFVNGIALLEAVGSVGDPADLLAMLHAIEDAAGRARPFPNASRTLDLDLIALDDLRRDAMAPILPHPRAHLRRFVLQPLKDVWPGWRHPVLGRTVELLLAGLPSADLPQPIPE
jgi:2-amino-4-hydroxy-6-hydroxymethyldihydropteridine diphosphokinase